MRYNQNAEETLDRRYKQESGSLHRLVLWLCRSHVNKVCKIVICRAHERGLVDSKLMHELAGMVDRMLWPERGRPQPQNDQALRPAAGGPSDVSAARTAGSQQRVGSRTEQEPSADGREDCGGGGGVGGATP